MKLLGLCMAAALAAGVAVVPHVARAQALGEAATLSAGVSAAGSGAGSALGRSLGRTMGSEGHRIASSSKTSTAGGVVNLHWSESERPRYGQTEWTGTKDKAETKKDQPAFVIYGAETQDEDSGGAAVTQPKPDEKAKKNGPAGGK